MDRWLPGRVHDDVRLHGQAGVNVHVHVLAQMGCSVSEWRADLDSDLCCIQRMMAAVAADDADYSGIDVGDLVVVVEVEEEGIGHSCV